jgi:hypothetical protein
MNDPILLSRGHFLKLGGASLAGAALGMTLLPKTAEAALTRKVAAGIFVPQNGPLFGDFSYLERFIANQNAGVVPKFISLSHYWKNGTAYDRTSTTNLRSTYTRYPGSTVMLSWEPWGVTLAAINNGTHDAYIDDEARRLKAVGHRIVLRFGQEMNGDWGWPWHNDPWGYVAAFRRVRTRFDAQGATNVEHYWCPNIMYPGGGFDFHPHYPGEAYVDWVGLDGYNYGSLHGSWESFYDVFKYSYDQLVAMSAKKHIIGEVGCTYQGGDKGVWFDGMHNTLKNNFPRIKAFAYSPYTDGSADWRVESPSSALAHWQSLLKDTQMQGQLVVP